MSDYGALSVTPSGRDGWEGITEKPSLASDTSDMDAQGRLEFAFARSFSGDDGERVLSHLRAITLGRALGPEASDAALRHLDGQRCLYLHIETLIDRGRSSK